MLFIFWLDSDIITEWSCLLLWFIMGTENELSYFIDALCRNYLCSIRKHQVLIVSTKPGPRYQGLLVSFLINNTLCLCLYCCANTLSPPFYVSVLLPPLYPAFKVPKKPKRCFCTLTSGFHDMDTECSSFWAQFIHSPLLAESFFWWGQLQSETCSHWGRMVYSPVKL